MKSKIIALYLPQFHETPENNEWWGKGYTDWTAVKKSKPCFYGHNQPRVPLDNNYYDLGDPNVIRQQAKLAKEYEIDGFCIYHYYSAGKLQMQKPAELLLENKDIGLNYFFSWANHDFKSLWFNGDGHMLRKQEYGGEDDWRNHFEYLAPFFKDQRYIKIDNKPVFVIYDIRNLPDYDSMLRKWNEWAVSLGFDGIYIIATKSVTNFDSKKFLKSKYVNKVFVFEPMNYRTNGFNGSFFYTTKRRIKTVLTRTYNSLFKSNLKQENYYVEKIYKAILNRPMLRDEFYGFFTDWDNTPRYPGNSLVFRGASPSLFYEYFNKVYKKSCEQNKEFIFINAWNEWGESAYLEPDVKDEYKYLEAIKKVKNMD